MLLLADDDGDDDDDLYLRCPFLHMPLPFVNYYYWFNRYSANLLMTDVSFLVFLLLLLLLLLPLVVILCDDHRNFIQEPFTCNTKDKHNEYIHPTRNGHDDLNMFNFHYVCCNTKQNPVYRDIYGDTSDGRHYDGLVIALTIQSVLSLITFVVTLVFTLSIVSNIKARKQSWNIYLIMLSIPDAIYNLFRFLYDVIVIKGLNTSIQTTWSVDWFYAVTNLYLNAVIVYQVHYFLRCVQKRARVPPPTIRLVLLQSFSVYLLGACCGIWMHYYHTIGNTIAGIGNYPRFLQIHKISLCAMVIPPVLFVTILCIDVWYRQLIPNIEGTASTNTNASYNSRTRIISIYFLRVIFIFMITWLPYMILITYGLRNSRVLGYIGMCITSMQGTLSVLVALSKDDIYWAVWTFVTFQCNVSESPNTITTTRGYTGGGGGGHVITSQESNGSGEMYVRSVPGSRRRRNSGARNSGIVRISGLFSNASENSTTLGGNASRNFTTAKSDSRASDENNRSTVDEAAGAGSGTGEKQQPNTTITTSTVDSSSKLEKDDDAQKDAPKDTEDNKEEASNTKPEEEDSNNINKEEKTTTDGDKKNADDVDPSSQGSYEIDV